MIPSKKTLSKLKAEIHINAARLFVDGCELFKNRSHSSAFALAILSLEELGKLEMVDHICDDISLNPHYDAQKFLEHLFSHSMFFSHRNKQMWASDPLFNFKKKRIKEIPEGVLDRRKQDALYVGYFNRRIRSPRRITPQKAYDELTIVFRKFVASADLGFNGFNCWSNAQSRMKAKRWLSKAEKAYSSLKKAKRKP